MMAHTFNQSLEKGEVTRYSLCNSLTEKIWSVVWVLICVGLLITYGINRLIYISLYIVGFIYGVFVLGSTSDAIYQQSQLEKGTTIVDVKGTVWFVNCKEAGKLGVTVLMNQCRGYEVIINIIGIFIISPLIGYVIWPYF